MQADIHRRRLLQSGLALGSALCLPPARACEFFTTHLRITHPWTRASAADASSAIVSMKFDEVQQADRLIAVETPVALSAEMRGVVMPDITTVNGRTALDFPIPAGCETLLHEAGPHLLLLGLQFALEVAREYPLQLIFERGGVVNATLSVDYTRFR